MIWTDVQGYFGDTDRLDYEHLVNALPDKAILVEVGCFRGRSLASIAPTIIRKGIKVYAVDIFDKVPPTPEYNEPDVIAKQDGMFTDFVTTMLNFGLVGNVTPIIKRSFNAAITFTPKSINMVFIDADHDAVKADIAAWWPVIKDGGVISGHDYDHNGRNWPGVKQAVHERFGQPYFGNNVWSVRKLDDNKFETESFLQ